MSADTAMALIGLGWVLLSFALLVTVIALFARINRKSRFYRSMLSDLYVASKIKQLAKKDNLNLIEEFESFKKWLKKEKITNSEISLDNAVEENLKEQLAEDIIKSV